MSYLCLFHSSYVLLLIKTHWLETLFYLLLKIKKGFINSDLFLKDSNEWSNQSKFLSSGGL